VAFDLQPFTEEEKSITWPITGTILEMKNVTWNS